MHSKHTTNTVPQTSPCEDEVHEGAVFTNGYVALGHENRRPSGRRYDRFGFTGMVLASLFLFTAGCAGDDTKWTYKSKTNEMTNEVSRYAEIRSIDTENLSYGPTHLWVVLRSDQSRGRAAFLQTDRSMLECIYAEVCYILARFDDEGPQRFTVTDDEDGSSTLALDDPTRFTESMKSARKVKIEAPLFQDGRITFEFNVEGFDPAKFAGGANRN